MFLCIFFIEDVLCKQILNQYVFCLIFLCFLSPLYVEIPLTIKHDQMYIHMYSHVYVHQYITFFSGIVN